jgi:hypothetical protein
MRMVHGCKLPGRRPSVYGASLRKNPALLLKAKRAMILQEAIAETIRIFPQRSSGQQEQPLG